MQWQKYFPTLLYIFEPSLLGRITVMNQWTFSPTWNFHANKSPDITTCRKNLTKDYQLYQVGTIVNNIHSSFKLEHTWYCWYVDVNVKSLNMSNPKLRSSPKWNQGSLPSSSHGSLVFLTAWEPGCAPKKHERSIILCVCIYIYIHSFLYIAAYIYIYIRICLYIHIHWYLCAYINICTYIYIVRTYTYIYIRTHVHESLKVEDK